MNVLYAGTAQVSIQGERALRFLDFTGNQAKYEVIGFENMPIVIIDSRRRGLLAIQELLGGGNVNDFAPKFNHPAHIRITQEGGGGVTIELSDTDENPSHILWIAIGLGDSMPVYDYVLEVIVPLEGSDGEYALIALYQSSSSDKPALSNRDKISASSSSSLSAWAG